MSAVLMLNKHGIFAIRSFCRIIATPSSVRYNARYSSTDKSKGPDTKLSEKKEESGGELQRSILEEVLISEKRKPTTFTGKVAEKASNTLLYTAVIGGIGLIGAFAYFLGSEFFAQDSPQKIFSKALKLVRQDGRCQDLFGETIAGFGEETSRGRRRHVASHKYEKDGRHRIRVMFHLKGERDEGIAQAEMEQRDGEWEWRFLYVETKRRPKTTHVLIDNRMSGLDGKGEQPFQTVPMRYRGRRSGGNLSQEGGVRADGTVQDIENTIEELLNTSEIAQLTNWCTARIDRILNGNFVSRIILLGNGHFDARWEAGAHQLAVAMSLQKKYATELLFQEPATSFAEAQWLADQDNVIVRKEYTFMIPATNGFEIVICIHGIHSFLNTLMWYRWENLSKIVFISNDYTAIHMIGSTTTVNAEYEALNVFKENCTSTRLPPYPVNPAYFSDTSIMHAHEQLPEISTETPSYTEIPE